MERRPRRSRLPSFSSASVRVAGAFAYPGISFTNPSLEVQPSDRLAPPEFYPEPDGESIYQSRTIIGGPFGPDNLSEGSRTTGVMQANRLKLKQIKRFPSNRQRCQ